MAAAAASGGSSAPASPPGGGAVSSSSSAAAVAKKKKKDPDPGAAAALKGRFYEAEFPQVDDIVVVQVRRLGLCGAYATLLEYGGKEGMMPLSELSKRRIRSPTKLVRIGRTEICTILACRSGTCPQTGVYIDLTKKKVEPERAAAKEQAFAKAKAVHGIMWHVASSNGVEVEELCKKVSWPLFKTHEDAFEALRRHINREVDLWQELDFSRPGRDLTGMAAKLKSDIERAVERKCGQLVVRLKAKVEVTCPEYAGIDAIKEAVLAGLSAPRPEGCELAIRLVAHPVFVITCTCADRETGIAAVDASMELIGRSIKGSGGYFRVRSHPEMEEVDDFSGDEDDYEEAPEEDGEDDDEFDDEAGEDDGKGEGGSEPAASPTGAAGGAGSEAGAG